MASAVQSPPLEKDALKSDAAQDALHDTAVDDISLGKGDVLQLESLDPALNAKMHLINNAIDEIGFTPYHWKLFVLNGFGYAVDSLILLLQSVIATPAFHEFGREGYAEGLNVAAYTGMLVGATFWGLGSDIFGRKHAFNISLFLCAYFSIVAGFMPNWPALGTAIALVGFGGGGNLVLDTTVFLEFLPGRYQHVVTLMALWWGIGMSGTGLLAWIFLGNFHV